MWLVLEGIDGAGKTTVAERLVAQHPSYKVLHVGPPENAVDDEEFIPSSPVDVGGSFEELVKAWSTEQAKDVIWDRGHLGNWVYQKGDAQMSVAAMRLLEALLMNHNGLTAVINTDPKIAFDRHSGDRTLGDLYTESIAFQQACHGLKSYWVATTVQSILTAFLDWQKYDSIKHMDSEGVGSNSPYIWVLGEQRNVKAALQVPFSTPAGMALVWPWVNPMTMRVSNALRPEADLERARQGVFGGETINDLYFRWATLGKPRVVTLGQTAFSACKAAGVTVSLEMEHPQHVWRFQQAESKAWQERLALKVGMIA